MGCNCLICKREEETKVGGLPDVVFVYFVLTPAVIAFHWVLAVWA